MARTIPALEVTFYGRHIHETTRNIGGGGVAHGQWRLPHRSGSPGAAQRGGTHQSAPTRGGGGSGAGRGVSAADRSPGGSARQEERSDYERRARRGDRSEEHTSE